MGIFDYLIDKDNGKPNPNMEYIYRMDMVWVPGKLGDIEMRKDSIVTNVVQLQNGGYEFLCKETGRKLCTNYAWALAENTPENILRIQKYDEEYKKFKEYEKYLTNLRNDIITLKPR